MASNGRNLSDGFSLMAPTFPSINKSSPEGRMPLHQFLVTQKFTANLGVDLPDGVDPRSEDVQNAIAEFIEADRELLYWMCNDVDGISALVLSSKEVREWAL